MNKIRWQDLGLLIVGVFVFTSPWLIIMFSSTPVVIGAGAWNHVAGALLMGTSIVALISLQIWEEIVAIAVGIWLIAAPWILHYSLQSLIWSSVIGGVLVVALAVSAVQDIRAYGQTAD